MLLVMMPAVQLGQASSTCSLLMLPLLLHAVFVDGQASQVRQLMLWSAGCYTATALFFSFKAGLQVRNSHNAYGASRTAYGARLAGAVVVID